MSMRCWWSKVIDDNNDELIQVDRILKLHKLSLIDGKHYEE